jgi:hypothetical protein
MKRADFVDFLTDFDILRISSGMKKGLTERVRPRCFFSRDYEDWTPYHL